MNKLQVRNVMTNLVVMVYPEDPIQEAASRLVRNGISGAPVVQDGKVVGVISEIDNTKVVMCTSVTSTKRTFLPRSDALNLLAMDTDSRT